MSKKKSGESEVDPVDLVEEPAPTPVPEATPKFSKCITFEQWASRRGIKTHRRSGMKAFCPNPNKLRPAEEWDSLLKTY